MTRWRASRVWVSYCSSARVTTACASGWIRADGALAVTSQDIASVINEQNVLAPVRHRWRGASPRPADDLYRHRAWTPAQCRGVRERRDQGGCNGSVVRLKDVARVELAATDYSRSSRLNGEPVALLAVFQLPDANALEVSERVRATLQQLSLRFPPGVSYEIPLDTADFVRESIREVEITLFIAAGLVLLVVFLSWRAGAQTLIPMLRCRSRCSDIHDLHPLGFSINTLTLFALCSRSVWSSMTRSSWSSSDRKDGGARPRSSRRDPGGDGRCRSPVIAIALVLSAYSCRWRFSAA